MKILLVQISFLGDTILSTPVIHAIKQAHPDAELWVLTTPPAKILLEKDPLIDGIIVYDKHGKSAGTAGLFKMAAYLKTMAFDMAYCLNRSARVAILLYFADITMRIGFHDAVFSFLYHKRVRRRKGLHQVLKYLSLVSEDYPLKFLDTDLRLYPPHPSRINGDIRAKLPPYGYILVAPASNWETKMWPGHNYRELIISLLCEGHQVVVTGAPDERDLISNVTRGLDVIDLSGQLGLDGLMHVMKNAGMLICNDSMPLHMACALQIPCVTIFCATTPSLGFWPWKNQVRIIEKHLPCRPCGTHGGDSCPNGTNDCRTGITIGQVLRGVDSLNRFKGLNLQPA